MEHHDIAVLANRIEVLETRQHRYRRFTSIAAIAICSLVLIAWSQFERETYPGDFVVMTETGKVKGVFTAADETGKATFALGNIDDTQTQLDIMLGYNDDGQPRLFFFDKEGNPRVHIGLDENGNGEMYITEKDGTILWSAP